MVFGPDVPTGKINEASNASTSLTLLERVRAADQAAWARLTELYGPLVYEWCIRMGLSSSDASDVGQEVFVRVWRAVADFRRDREGDSFRAWLRVITKRQVLDFWRKNNRQPQSLELEPSAMAELVYEEGDSIDLIDPIHERMLLYRRAIDLLRAEFTANTVEAFWKIVIEGEEARDVANQLQMSINSVYIAKSRVLARLRTELAEK